MQSAHIFYILLILIIPHRNPLNDVKKRSKAEESEAEKEELGYSSVQRA